MKIEVAVLEESGAYSGCLECPDVFWEPSHGEKVSNIAPTWVPRWRPNPSKIKRKTKQKSIKKSMPLKINFRYDLGGFWKGKWKQIGTQIEEKSMLTWKGHFLKKTFVFLRTTDDLEGSSSCKIAGKSLKNQLKVEGQDGRPLDIDF